MAMLNYQIWEARWSFKEEMAICWKRGRKLCLIWPQLAPQYPFSVHAVKVRHTLGQTLQKTRTGASTQLEALTHLKGQPCLAGASRTATGFQVFPMVCDEEWSDFRLFLWFSYGFPMLFLWNDGMPSQETDGHTSPLLHSCLGRHHRMKLKELQHLICLVVDLPLWKIVVNSDDHSQYMGT